MAPLRKRTAPARGGQVPKIIDATTSNDTSTEPTDIVSLPDNGGTFIAVMGATGTGKSSFINAASGAGLVVGGGLKSCTIDVQLSQTFNLKSNGPPVTLIDTPGFGDTSKSDVDTLGVITTFLANLYREKKELGGIIYMHRISDVRIGGVAKRNLAMFRKLCGVQALKNVVFVTSMWDNVTPEVGGQREAELKSEDIFFGPALLDGAVTMRYDGTSGSAQEVLLSLVKKKRTTLRVQREIVDENKAVAETTAGLELCRQLLDQSARHEKEMQELVIELDEAARAHDEQTRKELNEARQKVLDEIDRLETERNRFAAVREPAPEQKLVALGENVPKARGLIAWARAKIPLLAVFAVRQSRQSQHRNRAAN